MTDAPQDLPTATRKSRALIPYDPALREQAETTADDMLRDLIGNGYSDTAHRVATDYILDFARKAITNGPSADYVRVAARRLIELAKSDTGQARRVADFLMAWWNGPDLGKFDIADLFALDRAVSTDITTIIAFLAQHSGAIYPDQFGLREDIEDIIERWRTPETRPA